MFHTVGSAVVAAARKWRCSGCDLFKRLACIFQVANVGRIALWADNDEIVKHHVATVDAKTLGYKPILADAIVYEQRIGVAASTHGERLTGSDRDHIDAQARCSFEDRKDVAEQAGILSGGSGAERDEPLISLCGAYYDDR